MLSVLFLIAAGVVFFISISCGGYDTITDALKQTFLPKTSRDFWFPTCPLCWVTRGLVITAVSLAI